MPNIPEPDKQHVSAEGYDGSGEKIVKQNQPKVNNKQTEESTKCSASMQRPFQKIRGWRNDPFRTRARWTDIAIVVLTGGIVFLAIMQWREMHSGGLDTHTLAQQAVTQATQTTNLATAAGTQATAASNFAISAGQINEEIEKAEKDFFVMAGNSKAAIEATQEQMRQDQRAWVGVESPSFVINATDPIKTETHVIVLGKSPAVDIITRMGLKPFPSAYILQLRDIVLDSKEIQSGTGFPSTSFPLRESATLLPSYQGEFVNGIGKKDILYFFGEIRYRDIFNAAHWTHFAMPSAVRKVQIKMRLPATYTTTPTQMAKRSPKNQIRTLPETHLACRGCECTRNSSPAIRKGWGHAS